MDKSETKYELPSSNCFYKLRTILSQFNDLCSEFNKYVSPAYHHDRCERSVQMRLYSMRKAEFFLVFLIFFVLLGLTSIIGLSGAAIAFTQQINATQLKDQNITSLATGPFIVKSPPLSRFNKQLWLLAVFHTSNTDDEEYNKNFHLSVSVNGVVLYDHKLIKSTTNNKHVRTRSRHLHCRKETCSPILIGHVTYLEHIHYEFVIQFHGLRNFQQKYKIKDISFLFRGYNIEYTHMELTFRIIYVISSFIMLLWYGNSLRKYSVYDWSYEQKWIGLLLPLLLLFNGPVYSLTVLWNHWLIGMLDACFQITFFIALLTFWLCVYHGLRQNERRFLTFYLDKLAILVPMWIFALILAYYQKAYEFEDSTFISRLDVDSYETMKQFLFIFIGCYGVYLFLLILRAFTDLRNLPFFDKRLKFLSGFMMLVFTMFCFVTKMNFSIGIFEDSYMSNISTEYTSSASFMVYYSLINFYIFTMAYVYSPAKRSVFESSITKDNPAFSMINDSEEEGPFITEEDRLRRPLNRNLIDDDSD